MAFPMRILLVEDNLDDAELTERALRKLEIPVEIKVARDGQEALDLLLNPDIDLPTLVILDLKLPKISGAEVLNIVRSDERTKDLAMIVLVSTDEPADMRSSYEFCATSTMQKPVTAKGFLSAIEGIELL